MKFKTVRFDDELMKKILEYMTQDSRASFSDAVRRLITLGLSVESKK